MVWSPRPRAKTLSRRTKAKLSRTLFCSPRCFVPSSSRYNRNGGGGGIGILTEIERAFSAGHIVIDVGDTEGVDRRLTHSNAQQGDEKYRQDHRGYFALYPLLRQRVAFAVVHRVHLSRGRDPASRTEKKKKKKKKNQPSSSRDRFEFLSNTRPV